jgi:SSS family transporter
MIKTKHAIGICIAALFLGALTLPCSAQTTETAAISASFHVLDYVALLGYLIAIIGIGVYFARRENSTDDYFLAGRRIPWWAASLSIFSTMLSAVTFMAIPASAFKGNWVTILVNLGIILATPVAVMCFLPFYRRLNVTTIYEYLELRFSPGMRIYGSLSFVVLQLAKMGVFLLLPALALTTVTGFNVYACILIMGLLCTIYTVLGGIEAVIWTDVLQTCVLLGGGLLCLGVVFYAEQFNFSAMLELATENDKFRVFNMKPESDVPPFWILNSMAFWVVIIGGFFIQLVPFTSDQVIAQRFLTTRDEKAAARSLWAHAAIVVPASFIFFGLGTALFVFYASRPDLLPPADVSNDRIVPWFIATQLPAGLAGLVIAGLFAATMSTVDSGMHSIATSLVHDVYRKIRPEATDHQRLFVARILTVVGGLFGTISAVLIANMNPGSLWSTILLLIALFGSSLTGVFLLGVFTKRASTGGVAVGVVASISSLVMLRVFEPPIHGLLTAAVGVLSCVLVGYIASIFLPDRDRELKNLTLATLEATRDEG